MKPIFPTVLVATLGIAGVASAMNSPHVESAQETLNEYGFTVDASGLSDA
ncbi:MAG: hypothetical protein OXQ30_09010 [Boseongicola sp.]|nr:hypothetical protein [Boseongicola sp.]